MPFELPQALKDIVLEDPSVRWLKQAIPLGCGVFGAWQLGKYVLRSREFSKISCVEPSYTEMASLMVQTGGDLGKMFVALNKKYGYAPFKLRFLGCGIRLMIVSSPGMYDLSPMPKGKWYAMLHVLFGGNSLITLNHDGHKRHRRLLSHGFSMGSLHGFLPAFERHAHNLVKAWRNEQTVDLHQWMTRITFDIIADQAFGYDTKCIENSIDGNDFARCCNDIAKMVMRHWLHIPGMCRLWRLFNFRTFSVVDQNIYATIAKRRADRANHKNGNAAKQLSPRGKNSPRADARDLLDLMLDNEELTDLELRDETFILFLAGHETTAITMTWLLAHLSADPVLQKRVRREVLVACESGSLTKETMKCLPLLDKCINETLRLYPPAFAFTRYCEKDMIVDGVHVPAGYDVFINLLGMQRDPSVFPNPDVFDADRWEKNPEGLGPDGRAYWMPFSFGPRQCIGMHLARLEMRTVVCEVVRSYEMKLVGPIPDWHTLPITTSPSTHVQIELTPLDMTRDDHPMPQSHCDVNS